MIDKGNKVRDYLRRRVLPFFQWAVLAVSVGLIAYITWDTLENISFVESAEYRQVQTAVCWFFLFEIMLEIVLADRPWHSLLRNVPFILVCVPYTWLFHRMGIEPQGEWGYLMRFIPMVRAAFVMAVMWGFMTKNWVKSMFGTYMIILIGTLYCLSLMFYVEEHFVNSGVANYWDSLWYSVMQMTTCGSSINPITPAGKVIGVVLSVEGLVLFPVFTVYFTDAFVTGDKSQESVKNA